MDGWKKVLTISVIFLFGVCLNVMKVQAAAGENVWQSMNMETAQRSFRELFPAYEFDGEQVLSYIMQGKIGKAASVLASGLINAVKAELAEIRTLFVMILILGIVAALFSNFADIFQSHQIADIAFYFLYLLMIAVVIRVFGDAASVISEMLNHLITFMQLFIPAYLMAVSAAAGAASAAAGYQIFLIVVYLVERCYLTVLMPLLDCFILLSVINGIWMEEKLNLLLDLLLKTVGYGIKITIGIITGVSLLQSLISPALDALEASALKKAVSVIPGIGNLTEGMFELVLGSAVLIKNSIGIYITIVMIFVCLIPVIKILLLSGVLKAGAAMIGIVSDKRMVNCANRVGDGALMLLRLALSAVGLFIVVIAIVAYATNRGA